MFSCIKHKTVLIVIVPILDSGEYSSDPDILNTNL